MVKRLEIYLNPLEPYIVAVKGLGVRAGLANIYDSGGRLLRENVPELWIATDNRLYVKVVLEPGDVPRLLEQLRRLAEELGLESGVSAKPR